MSIAYRSGCFVSLPLVTLALHIYHKIGDVYDNKVSCLVLQIQGKAGTLPPTIKKGTFTEWLRRKGKLGGQHKVPRLSNERNTLEEILTFTS